MAYVLAITQRKGARVNAILSINAVNVIPGSMGRTTVRRNRIML